MAYHTILAVLSQVSDVAPVTSRRRRLCRFGR
jgi:hypothetical protein